MSDLQITIVGNLTDEPELRYTPNGAAVVNFRVAHNPREFDRQTNEWKDGTPTYFRSPQKGARHEQPVEEEGDCWRGCGDEVAAR